MGLISFMGLTGCSSDDEYEDTERGVPVTLTSYVTAYTDYNIDKVNESRMTRTNTWAPTGFTEAQTTDLKSIGAIGAFFTKDASGGNPAVCEQRRFWYSTKWNINEEISNPDVYRLYGYLPYNAATATITPNGTYANGAVLTLNGLSGIMIKDVCVLVGAREGTNATTPATRVIGENSVGVLAGMFDCDIKAGENPNYLFLLFDHIYAQLLFKFTINEKYHSLRTIKIKRLELMAYSDYTYSSNKKMKKAQSLTVTLQANTTGASPIENVSNLTADNTSGSMDPVLLFNDENAPLVLSPSEWKEYPTYVPEVPSFFMLKTTYDVYDKNTTEDHPEGNLIRKNCVAENKINPRALFNQEKLERGKLYTINLTVNPTYLYVLSEPDLDNPTLEVVE